MMRFIACPLCFRVSAAFSRDPDVYRTKRPSAARRQGPALASPAQPSVRCFMLGCTLPSLSLLHSSLATAEQNANQGEHRVSDELKLCLFSSTPDIEDLGFIVKVLTGSPEELAERAAAWGYDGIEFLPDPAAIPDPEPYKRALANHGVGLYVVNSGRIAAQGMALLDKDAAVRDKSLCCFKELIDFAAEFDARVGLGMARGKGIEGASKEEMDCLADEVFGEIASHARQRGVVVMLEAAEPEVTTYINTMEKVMERVDSIDNPSFSAMLDTHQLFGAEPTLEHGIRATRGEATHIHFYDPSRWPPGVLTEKDRLDWPSLMRTLCEVHLPQTGSVVLAPEGDPEPPAIKAREYLRSFLKRD